MSYIIFRTYPQLQEEKVRPPLIFVLILAIFVLIPSQGKTLQSCAENFTSCDAVSTTAYTYLFSWIFRENQQF